MNIMSGKRGRVKKNKQSTKQVKQARLARGAMKVFFRYGFQGATMRQIARTCNMSAGNIYNYVKSKEDMLRLSLEYAFERTMNMILAPVDLSDPVVALKDTIRNAYTNLNEEQDFILFAYQELKHLPQEYRKRFLDIDRNFAEMFEKILLAGLEKKSFRNDFDPHLLAQNIVVLGHMWCFRRWALSKEYTFNQYLEKQLDWLLSSIMLPSTTKALRCKSTRNENKLPIKME